MSKTYRLTTVSCFIGIFVQAIICNLTPILFIPMMDMYHLSFGDLGVLAGVNFIAQVVADILFSGMLDKKGLRFFVMPTCLIACFGLVLFAMAPVLFPRHIMAGLLIATIISAMSSGLLEVTLSPLVDAIPSDSKGAAMSLMHSFYAWGQAVTIIVTTLCLFAFGNEHWQWIVLGWAVVPMVCFFLFLRSPFPPMAPVEQTQGMRQLVFRPFYIVALLAILFGAASELIMNQWASAFMERGLSLPKVVGDLIGMCGFALMMGCGRTMFGVWGKKWDMHKALVLCSAAAVVCYILVALSPWPALNIIACVISGFTVCLLWPGTLVVSSERYPKAGAWLFAILAAAGDIGASFGSWVAGIVVDNSAGSWMVNTIQTLIGTTTEQATIRLGILVGAVFASCALICHLVLLRMRDKKSEKQKQIQLTV